MKECLFGIETEYAASGSTQSGAFLDPEEIAMTMVYRVADQVPHLCNQRGTDLFLQNGARMYVDCGGHPEFATPECLDPWDLVRHVRAGDRILERQIEPLHDYCGRGAQIAIFRSNVDYIRHSTWGCHESYLSVRPMAAVAARLIPHLVSRIVFTGAGGLNPDSPGIEFSLSPRAAFLNTVTSQDSVNQRGIIHTRQEPLAANGYHRLHLLCGESLCSDLALWLRVGTTAIVLAMIEADVDPGGSVSLIQPLSALRAFASDPTCRSTAELTAGGAITAIAIQRRYLEHAESYRGARFMPSWTGEVCDRWRDVLDRLEQGPAAVATQLDWAIKYALYGDYARRRQFSPDAIVGYTRHLKTVGATESTTAPGHPRMTRFLDLQRELFEIDTRFGQLGPDGVFNVMDTAGALEHHVDGVTDADVERAMSTPPARGRARVRGEAIARLAGQPEEYHCQWTGIRDLHSGRSLDLSDPFVASERWTTSADVARREEELAAAREDAARQG